MYRWDGKCRRKPSCIRMSNGNASPTPLVSVLMAAYNAEAYVAASIESILNQSLSSFELIVSDDCSTDRTWEIAQGYAEGDVRVRVVKTPRNLGIAGNRNSLVGLAQADFIAWQDADDVSLPERLAIQLDVMNADPSIGICGGGLQFFSDKRGDFSKRLYATDDATLRKMIFRYSPVAQPAAMIRREVFRKVGHYDLRLPPAEDIDMSFRIGEHWKFANVASVVVRYREHPNSATFTRLSTIERNTIAIRNRFSKSPAYSMSAFDRVFNFLQKLSIGVVPARTKIWLFSLWRNA